MYDVAKDEQQSKTNQGWKKSKAKHSKCKLASSSHDSFNINTNKFTGLFFG